MSDAQGQAGPDLKTPDEAQRVAKIQAAASGHGKTPHLAVLLLAQCSGRLDLTGHLTRQILAEYKLKAGITSTPLRRARSAHSSTT